MNPVAKIAITGVNLAASALVGKGLSYVWKGVTGNEPPTIAPESEDTVRNVIIWAVLTSVVGTLVSIGIARAQRRSCPPGSAYRTAHHPLMRVF